MITRTGKGHFCIATKKNYAYALSDTAKNICSEIRNRFPFVEFQIWELYQMNEFVNHQLGRNLILVEVEKGLDESVFDFLFPNYPHVLFNPSEEEYYRYSGEETIVVRKMVSEAPAAVSEYRQAPLEKLLVDLFGRDFLGTMISRSEYRAIYEDSFAKYIINQPKMFRYARRRGVEQKIRAFIREETDIVLEESKRD